MSPEVSAATSVGACRMKIVSAGTPYLVKKPCSLATQRGRTRALTAAWAMILFEGADAAVRSLMGIDSTRIANDKIMCLPIAYSYVRQRSEQLELQHLSLETQAKQINCVLAQYLSL